jgi:hypothetical protein
VGLRVGICLTDQAVKEHGHDFLLFVVAFPSLADFFPGRKRKQHLKFTLFV